ncbi:MAG TPA: ABC transporter permease [Acidimicrobiia bacterium]|nr:ABC transporter permease [Acidimicrobiia bacterium]
MDKFLIFTITGLSTAAIYAVAASGLVLTYTTTGIFNFAHGAIGMVCAFAYWQVHFDWGWPTWVSLIVIIGVVAPLLGVLLEVVIMRNLEGTSEGTKLVVSISLLAALVGLANWVWEPGVQRSTAKFFEGKRFELFDVAVTWHEATTVIIAIVVAIGLRLLLYRSRPGIAMRATVDDRSLTALNGARSDLVATLAWAIGCSLAALSGILFIGTLALEAGVLSLLIVNAYAAALIGRLRSLPLTFLGAVIIGLAESYWQGYRNDVSLLSSDYLATFASAIPVIILFIVLLVIPNPRLKGHGAVRQREQSPNPSLRGAWVMAAVLVGGTAVMSAFATRSHQLDIAEVFAFGIIALSLVPLLGFGGQVSLAQLSFAGIGAVTMAQVGDGGNPLGIVAAAVVAGAVGAVIALPALRLSGIYLALATASFAVALERWVFRLPAFEVFGLFRVNLFEQGSTSVDRLELFGIEFNSPRGQAILVSIVFSLLAVLVVAIRRSAFGRRLLAMKDSEAACATLGMNLTLTKLTVFSLSAAIAGVGGALYGGMLQSINPENFSFINGLPVFMLTVVGGVGAVGGALFAGISLATLTVLPTLLPSLKNVLLVTPGLVGIGLGRNPNGAVSQMREGFAPLRASRLALTIFAGELAIITVLRGAEIIENWPTVVLAIGALVTGPLIGDVLERRRITAHEPLPTPTATEVVPLEWVGIVRPFTDDDVRAMDEALALPEIADARA